MIPQIIQILNLLFWMIHQTGGGVFWMIDMFF